MRKGWQTLELILTFLILGIIISLGWKINDTSLLSASQTLISHLRYIQYLALNDRFDLKHQDFAFWFQEHFPSIDTKALIENPKLSMWQIQFHLSGVYTKNSYSLYKDTPRYSPTTNYDGRPMSGDFIALEIYNNQCLSGYNNTNVSDYCKNNTAPQVRLKEHFGIEKIIFQGDSFCKEKDGGRIYFDDFGSPYCGKNPQKLKTPFKITLIKNHQSLSVCITPITGFVELCKE